jgi:hypothetical protein
MRLRRNKMIELILGPQIDEQRRVAVSLFATAYVDRACGRGVMRRMSVDKTCSVAVIIMATYADRKMANCRKLLFRFLRRTSRRRPHARRPAPSRRPWTAAAWRLRCSSSCDRRRAHTRRQGKPPGPAWGLCGRRSRWPSAHWLPPARCAFPDWSSALCSAQLFGMCTSSLTLVARLRNRLLVQACHLSQRL